MFCHKAKTESNALCSDVALTLNFNTTEKKVNKERELRLFFETLEHKPQLIDTWDERLWIILVEKM